MRDTRSTPTDDAASSTDQCSTPGCTRRPRGRGPLCNACRQRAARAEKPAKSHAGLDVPLPADPDAFLAQVGPPDPITGCREWTGPKWKETGYGIHREGDRMIGAHRVALALHLGRPVPGGIMTLHSCDNPPCCEPSHLREGDGQANARDMVERGRSLRGERHNEAVLTNDLVLEYRRRYAAGERFTHLMRESGIGAAPFHAMLTGKTWGHLPGAVRTDRHKRQVRGETAPLAKLTEGQVIEARRRYAEGETLTELGAAFGVEKSTMRQAITGKTWPHLPGAVPVGLKGNIGAQGERSGSAKLTADDVRAIRRRAAAGETQKSLAAEYGVLYGTISKIVLRQRWQHIPD